MTAPRTEINTVHFLNQVDEKNLLQLMEDEQTETPACSCTEKCVPGSVNTDCPVCSVNMSECAGKEAEPEPEETEQPEPEEDKGGGMGGAILLVVLLLAAAGGGAFYYFKIMKPKKDAAKGSSNLDDLDFDEDDEDEEELETERREGRESMKLVIAEKPSVGAAIAPAVLRARMKSAADILRAAATLCPGVSGI